MRRKKRDINFLSKEISPSSFEAEGKLDARSSRADDHYLGDDALFLEIVLTLNDPS